MRKLLSAVFRAIARYFLVIIGIILAVVAGVVAFVVFIEMQLPDVNVLKDFHMQVPLRIYSREGALVAEYGASRRIPVTLDQVPKPLILAILATEDQRFYSHPGVDFIGLFRAFKVLLGTGQKSQGASTITMQVARNFFLTHKKTYIRKIREILLALKIERTFSKDKILELYLNRVYFGNHAYGVAAAANVYYGKNLNQLSLAEMAMIAGLPQAPSRNNPIARPAAATERRNHVLLRMLGVGDITNAQYQQAVHEVDKASYHGPLVMVKAPYVGELVRQYMVQQYGESVYDHGFSVYTTLSGPMQNAANQNLEQGLVDYTERHGYHPSTESLTQKIPDWKNAWAQRLAELALSDNLLQPAAVLQADNQNIQAMLADSRTITIPRDGWSWAAPELKNDALSKVGDIIWVRQAGGSWRLETLPQIQGALVSLNPQNGAVLAMVGGFDFSLSEFNRVTQAQRQAGSVFKPFIYSAALNNGFTLASTINDAPVVMNDSGEDNIWRPRNDSRQFSGMTRLREGLVRSLNVVSIRLLQEVGIPETIDFIQRFGFDVNQLPKTLSLALGTGLTSPLTVATGYSVFANGGFRVAPFYIDHILDEDGKNIFQANPAQACPACIFNPQAAAQMQTPIAPQVIDPQNAYLISQALQDAIVHGTGQAAKVLQRPDIAGKTGTTNNKVDAWFSGFNNQVVTTVWIGYDDLTPTHEYGGEVALAIWINFMRTALAGMPISTTPQPPGIVTARIDPGTGLLANAMQQNAMFEIFREGSEPHGVAPTPSGEPSAGATKDQGDIF
jgi:penicillin-binding protein 1A